MSSSIRGFVCKRRVNHIGNRQPRPRRACAFEQSSQSVSCSHVKGKRSFLNPIIQLHSLNSLYLLMENIRVFYDYFF